MFNALTSKVEAMPIDAIRIEDSEAIRDIIGLLSKIESALFGVTGTLLFLSNSESTQNPCYSEMLDKHHDDIAALQSFTHEMLYETMENLMHCFTTATQALEAAIAR